MYKSAKLLQTRILIHLQWILPRKILLESVNVGVGISAEHGLVQVLGVRTASSSSELFGKQCVKNPTTFRIFSKSPYLVPAGKVCPSPYLLPQVCDGGGVGGGEVNVGAGGLGRGAGAARDLKNDQKNHNRSRLLF